MEQPLVTRASPLKWFSARFLMIIFAKYLIKKGFARHRVSMNSMIVSIYWGPCFWLRPPVNVRFGLRCFFRATHLCCWVKLWNSNSIPPVTVPIYSSIKCTAASNVSFPWTAASPLDIWSVTRCLVESMLFAISGSQRFFSFVKRTTYLLLFAVRCNQIAETCSSCDSSGNLGSESLWIIHLRRWCGRCGNE